jgi:hypothetical protein
MGEHRTDGSRMRRRLAGLHEGPDLRAERGAAGWDAQGRLRDLGESIGVGTGLYEYHAEAGFVPMGTYRTLRLARVALDLVRHGSHVVRLAHSHSDGAGIRKVPTRVIRYAEARSILVEHGLAEPEAGDAAPLNPR